MAEKPAEKKKGCLRSIWIGWIKICRWINDFIESLFEAHTRFITKHHRKVIIACLLFVCLMAIGAVRFKALLRNEELFIPQGSQAFTHLNEGQKYFSLKFRVEEFIVKLKSGGNIFESNLLFKKALELHEKIIKIDKFNASCIKTSANDCMYLSGLEVFGYNAATIEAANTSAKIKTAFNSYFQDPKKLLKNGRQANLNYQNILGKFDYHKNNGTVKFANALRVTYYMVYADTKDDIYSQINGWEDKYISLCGDNTDQFDNAGLELNYFAARTRDDAILSSTVGDLPLFSVAFILMVAFCLLVFMKIKSPVQGHLTVGITGIFVIMLGVGCGFGLAMLIGTDFVAFTGILMFLILGIGMDNMFIIVDAVEQIDPDIQGPERLVVAMKHVGGSITMTTSTDLVAFAVSTVSDFPAVHLFCVYAALSILFAYLMLITLFLALITADINRMEAGKRDICPCYEVEGYNENPWILKEEAISKRLLRKWGEILMTTPMKVIVVLAACGLLAAGAYGTSKITQKFEWKKLAPDGSYFRKFTTARDDNFPAGYDVSVVMPPTLEYTLNSTQQNIIDLDAIAGNNSRYEKFTLNWMRDYLVWSKTRVNFNFNNDVQAFLNDQPQYKTDVNYDVTKKIVTSSRVVFFYENSNDAINQADAMKSMRNDLKEKSPLKTIFPISIMFIYAEQFAAVRDDTIRNLAICAGTILIITLPYLTHPGITTLVFLSFTSLLFELLGLMTAWDVSLDVIAMIIIIMALGFSVDYTCHIAHAFMISQKDTAEARVIDALETMGTSVLNGGVSTFLGMLITAFSGAEGFRIFFKMVFGIVLLGLLHGLIFLPVLLSIFIRHDLRDDMKEFIEKHEEKERKKSVRRFNELPETEKRKQSVAYRKKSENGYGAAHDDVELRKVSKADNENGSLSETTGSPNPGYDNKDEIPVFYSNGGDKE